MHVELSERTARMAADLVEHGRFGSVDDAVEYGLMAIQRLDAEAGARLALETNESWAELREKVREADEDIAAGHVKRVGSDFVESLRERVRQRVQVAGKLGT